jgi:hypothetical protein
MAKALFGHVGVAADRRLVDELTYLRSRVRTLEGELARLRAERDESPDDLDTSLRELTEASDAVASAAIPA